MGFLGRMMAEHGDTGGYMKCEKCGKRSTHRKIEYDSYRRILTLKCPKCAYVSHWQY
jgi:tRNA(Ile2) C34 agmatinyltransferase TiaS